MNKIYKIVWNAAQEAWVAVSELAKGHVKASSSGKNAKQSTVVEEEGSASSTLYSLGKAAANAMVIGGVAVTLFSLSQTAQAADKHETTVVAEQGTREKAKKLEPNALLALGRDTKAGGRSTVVIGESSRINGTVAMALGNGINIDHGIAPTSVFLGKSIDDRYNQNKTKVQSQYVKSQVIGSDIYFSGLTNNKVDGLKQATLMGNDIQHYSEEQSNSMMTASNFVFKGVKAQDSAVNGHGITVNLTSPAKRAVLNRSSITGTNININSTGDINEMLVSGTTISVTRQNNALGGALVGNNINFDSTDATVNTEKVNYVGQDINVTASSTSNPLFGQGIALHNSTLSGAPTFGQNIKSSNSTISNTLTQGYNTTFNEATVNDSVLTVNNATITGSLTNATLMGRDINTIGNVVDTQVVGNRNTVTAWNTQVLGSGITANVNNSVYLGDASEVETVAGKASTAGVGNYASGAMQDGVTANFSGGDNVVGAVTVGNATHTRRIQHVAPGNYHASSTDAVNGSQLYAVGEFANRALTKATQAATAAKAADAKAVAADTKAGKAATDAANALTTANGIDGKVSKALQAVDKGWTLQTEPGTETTINAANNVVRFKAGDNIKISQTGGNITVALTNDINVTKVTAGTVVAGNLTAKNATLGGAGHTVKVENGTNVDMGGNQIHNVGDGVKDSDAATVGQLNRALDQVAGSPAKINELNNRVDKMNKEMRGYAANAMAVTALPQVYTAGDSMISAAVGSQGGAASVAVGYSRASDNGKVVIKLNMAASSSGEKGVAAGVGYKW